MADPQIPGYLAMRQGADWASSVRGQTVFFGYDPGAITINQPGTASTVPVSTAYSAQSRPTVTSATVQLDGFQDLVLDGNQFSAVFWTESAVEKFLLPYYVSAAGPYAQTVLSAITGVFYNYPPDEPVCGLAFGYASEPILGPKQLLDTLYVISCQGAGTLGATLACTPLGTLLDSTSTSGYTQGMPPAPAASLAVGPDVQTATTSLEPTFVDSVGAREVAEYVSGLRGREVLVYSVLAPGGLDPQLTPVAAPGAELLFTAFAPEPHPWRPRPQVTLNVPGQDSDPLVGPSRAPDNVPDAVFWTDAAVEMLMVPYYASVEGHAAPWYLMALLGKWAGLIPTGLVDAVELAAQLIGDLATLLTETPLQILESAVERVDGQDPVGLVASDVYAIIHLPRSEWVDEENPSLETILLENRTFFRTTHGDYPLVAKGRRLVPSRRIRG
jgi:hypothetical protein